QIVFTYGVKINNFIDEGDNISFVKYGFTVIDLSEIPFERFLSSDSPSINALGILSKDCDVRRLIEKIFEYELEKSKTVLLIDKIYILSKLSEKEEEVYRSVEEIRKIDIRELKIFQIGEKEGLEKGIKEGLEKGIKEGLEKGIKEGLEKGLKEGLELMIKMKFGNKGEQFISKVREIDDIGKLRKIARSIVKSKSLRELKKILGNKK
ncbi:MAG: hypothetical protein NZ927_09925, partial [Candidatus Calescibacterium sp.]|nr:hypothetical protein [Candidatus Calescibacterium sp.]